MGSAASNGSGAARDRRTSRVSAPTASRAHHLGLPNGCSQARDGSGSTIAAGNSVTLAADNDIALQASKDTGVTVGQNSSSGANVGVTFGAGAQNGFSIQLGVSQGKGSNNQNDTHYNATQVSGGKAVNITSGGNLTLNGAVVQADRVRADVGGDLAITTLQDASVGQSRQSSGGLNLSLCIPPICYGAVVTASASAAGAKGDGVFVSPNTQSGIQAGDGGFDVNVKGNTTLAGAVIESTQAAIDSGKNNFHTAGQLTMTDLQNVSQSSGSSYAVSGGVSVGYTTAPNAETGQGSTVALAGPNSRPSGSAGVGSYEGNNQNSTTRSGISGVAGDQTVRTGNAASAGTLVRDWNTQSIVRDVQAQATITQQFNQNAAREIGSYAGNREREAAARGDKEEAARWAEGGEYRVALHTAAGALSGGVAGAIGAGASAALMPRIGSAIEEMGLPAAVAQALGAVTAAAIGATVGGAAGAASAYSVDVNNRQLHPAETKRIKELAGGDPVKEARLAAAACALVRCADGVPLNDPNYTYLQALQSAGNSEELRSERETLSNQPGPAHSAAMLFRYDTVDATRDWLSQNAMGTRAAGAVQGALGALGAAGSAGLCASVIGCVGGAVSATISADFAQAGIRQAATGEAQTPFGQQALQSLGLDASSAAMTYALIGLSPAVVESVAVSRAFNAAAQYNSLARASYSDFVPNGVPATPATMSTPVAQALVADIKAASPGLTEARASEIAAGIIASGSSLPTAATAAPGSVLVKVVPKGDTINPVSPYSMSPEQARTIAAMSPAEAGVALGLPAGQAAKIFANGMDFYAIAARPGANGRVFLSEVAPTTQGSYTTVPTAQQVIVPNRSAWSPPVQVNPYSLRGLQ